MINNWAILKCKFADDTGPDVRPPLDYLDLFTGSGTGTNNMTDFFHDMSHGRLDLTGSQVFGWFTVPARVADYQRAAKDPVAPAVNRNGLYAQCRQAAVDAGINLSAFAGTVVTMNGTVDAFGYPHAMAVFCSSDNIWPSVLGQEMGHGYGLDHSRREGSDAEYKDRFDVMSTLGDAWTTPDPRWNLIGPGLNAANMRSQGWLDETRVWKPGPGDFSTTITLRPLHHRDLAGSLAAELPGGELVEFRVPAGWDAALPQACVLVHDFTEGHSNLRSNTAGGEFLVVGDEYRTGIGGYFGAHTSLRVDSIDPDQNIAVLNLEYSFLSPPELTPWPWPLRLPDDQPLATAILIGGKFIPVPPRTPAFDLLQPVLAHLSSDDLPHTAMRNQVRRTALQDLVATATQALDHLDAVRIPAPPSPVPNT